jgi:hypothetical protein
MNRALKSTLAICAAAVSLSLSSPYLEADDASATAATVKDAKPEQAPYKMEPWDFQNPARFKALMKEREELQQRMHALRVKLLQEDPELEKLHKRIMELHKELALQLESKKDMRKFCDKLKEIDAELDKLPHKDSQKK